MFAINMLTFARDCLLWWTAMAVMPIEQVYDAIEHEIKRREAVIGS